MVDGESGREQLLEAIRSIDTETLINMILVLSIAYILSTIISVILSKISEKMSRNGRIKAKMLTPVIKFVLYILAFYYIS